jgi:hypothetical protein
LGTLDEALASKCVNDDPGPIPLDAVAAAACWPVMALT